MIAGGLCRILLCSIIIAGFWIASLVTYEPGGTPIIGAARATATDKPVNFIFLVDVSGSMVMQKTMVTDAAGNKITLFEALRQAVRNIIADNKLIKSGSRVSFITFGTTVSEKTAWPTTISSEEDRTKLVSLIDTPEELAADRKGDTYMGGGLNQALSKANEFISKSDPCTTTFIMMLTDGWDEPPKDAKYNVKDIAKQFVARKEEIKNKVGIDTWQVAIIGLKSLPRIKEGTTTAAELSGLLGATFLDVTQEKGRSVSEKIAAALGKIISNQRGTFTLVSTSASDKRMVATKLPIDETTGEKIPVLDFGVVNNVGEANGSFVLRLSACDLEELTSVKESSVKLPRAQWKPVVDGLKPALRQGETITLVADLPGGAVSIIPEKSPLGVSPEIDEGGHRNPVEQTVKLTARAGSKLPVGTFLGCMNLTSTARVPERIFYLISAPSRLTTKDDEVSDSVKRQGFIILQDSEAKLKVTFMQSEGSAPGATYNIEAVVNEPRLIKRNGHPIKSGETLDPKLFNNGEPIKITLDTNVDKAKDVVFNVFLPKTTHPGTYRGTIQFKIQGPPDMVAPADMPFEIELKPSDWEIIAPIAVPMALLLIVGLVAYVYFVIVNQPRR